MAGSYSMYVAEKNAQRNLMGKGEGNRPLWKETDGWDNNATTDVKEIG